jgi:uncharacterized cupredoxin-like copper-binding protein
MEVPMTPLRLVLAGALTAAALAVPASSQPAMPVVNITLASHYFAPSPVHLAGGVPVRLVFVNRAGKRHDFTARSFFRYSRILRGRVHDGEISLAPGQTAVIDLIPLRGTYRVHCGEPFHSLLGMRTRIIVS